MLASALALAASASGPVEAAPHPTHLGHLPHSHTHAPAEIDETPGPILLQLTYTAEVMGNASGGLRRGTRYLDNLDIVFEADMEKLVGWTGAQVHVYGLYNNGKSISDLVGDTQAVSNIEAGTQAIRLCEAWVDQKIGDRLSVKAGLYDLNFEFDALDAAGLFVSSPHGIGTDFAQSGRNGPSIFPSTSLATRVQWQPSEGWRFAPRYSTASPVIPTIQGARPSSSTMARRSSRWRTASAARRWQATARALAIYRPLRPQRRDRDRQGQCRHLCSRRISANGRRRAKVDAFFRLGTASGRFNMFDGFAGGGLKFSGWVPGRGEDEFGIALAAGFTSNSYRAATGAESSEVAIHEPYRAPITSWLALQPSVHYIRNPSADPGIADALVLGLRAEMTFSLAGF